MARIRDRSRQHFTQCPGTDAYMPPEAVQDRPQYTEKIDCFAFGVIVIQILTKLFPDPGDRYKANTASGHCQPTTVVVVPEVERRHNHISQIDERNPLLPIALDCIRDEESERPPAQHLCERLALLKQTQEYTDKGPTPECPHSGEDDVWLIRHMRQVHQLIQQYENHLEDKEHRISSLESENQQYSQQIASLQQRISQLQHENQLLSNELELTTERIRVRDLLEHRKDLEVQRDIMTMRKQLEQVRHELKEKNEIIKVKENQLESQRQRHIQQIRDLKAENSRQKQFLDKSSASISHLYHIISLKDMEIKQLERILSQFERQKDNIGAQVEIEVEKQIKRLSQTSRSLSISSSLRVETVTREESQQPSTKFRLEWSTESKEAPCGMISHCNAVVHGEIVYFQPADTNSLFAYDTQNDTWKQLPNCKNRGCSVAVVSELVTVIGGSKFVTGYSRKLYSLAGGTGKTTRWAKALPPMQIGRSESTSLCTEKVLIVAGGEGRRVRALTAVEVMNIETKQWSMAADLPKPVWGASTALCGNYLYMVGGVHERPTKSIYKYSIASLLHSTSSYAVVGEPLISSKTWERVTDLPVTGPTCVVLHGELILIGGEEYHGKCRRTAAIHKYNQTTASWEVINEMPTSRNQCFAAVLPDSRLMVVGGWIDTMQYQTASTRVDFARTKSVNPKL